LTARRTEAVDRRRTRESTSSLLTSVVIVLDLIFFLHSSTGGQWTTGGATRRRDSGRVSIEVSICGSAVSNSRLTQVSVEVYLLLIDEAVAIIVLLLFVELCVSLLTLRRELRRVNRRRRSSIVWSESSWTERVLDPIADPTTDRSILTPRTLRSVLSRRRSDSPCSSSSKVLRILVPFISIHDPQSRSRSLRFRSPSPSSILVRI